MTDLEPLTRESAASDPDRLGIPPPKRSIRTRVLLPLTIVAAATFALFVALHEVIFPGVAVSTVAVVADETDSTQVAGEVVVQASGWIEPDPFPIFVPALTDGIVEEIAVLEGESVERGQVIARLVDDEFRLEVARKRADLKRIQARRSTARAELTAASEIETELVDRQGTLDRFVAQLAQRRAESKRLEALITVQEAELEVLQDELERKRPLVESGTVSELEYRVLESDEIVQRATLTARKADLEFARAQIEEAESQVTSARRHLELLIEERRDTVVAEASLEAESAAVQIAEAELALAELALERTEIKAPVTGVCMRRLVVPGSRVSRGGGEHSVHVVHLYDPEALQVRVDVPLADAALVVPDQRAQVSVEALKSRRFEGRVTRLVPEADIQKNTVEVKVAIDNPDRRLKPEMLARVKFLAVAEPSHEESKSEVALLIPRSALVDVKGTRARCFVVEPASARRGRAFARDITIRDTSGEFVRVVDGLGQGMRVVDSPPRDLRSGDSIDLRREREVR